MKQDRHDRMSKILGKIRNIKTVKLDSMKSRFHHKIIQTTTAKEQENTV